MTFSTTEKGSRSEPGRQKARLVESLDTVASMWSRASAGPVVVLVLSALFVAGCSGAGAVESDHVQAAAEAFVRGVANAPAEACQRLAPQTLAKLEDAEGPCVQSLPEQLSATTGSDVGDVAVYGKDAMVHIGDDTLFLARFSDGWRVTAAGCTPRPDRPYDCTVQGN